jgi:1,4-alpha-glucan branching enzyme
MKHNKNHDNAQSDGPQLQPVRFEFTHPTARTVCVAGTFDNWRPDAKPMHPLGGGRWLKETVLPPGTYEYCLVVDGKWMPDPLARETVPNPFGGVNSVLKVARSPEESHLASAEHSPLENTNKPKA